MLVINSRYYEYSCSNNPVDITSTLWPCSDTSCDDSIIVDYSGLLRKSVYNVDGIVTPVDCSVRVRIDVTNTNTSQSMSLYSNWSNPITLSP